MTERTGDRSRMPGGTVSELSLELKDISKRFPGVQALKDVNFAAAPGEVHALVGENGAGKSTLIGVAAGAVSPDSGTVAICGKVMRPGDPRGPLNAGLSVVYQHPAVLPELTVAENLYLNTTGGNRPRLRDLSSWTRERIAAVGGAIFPQARVSELSPAGRHLLELARALLTPPKVLILDEPTEPFSAAETERLFEIIGELARAGTCIIYISHRLPDVKQIADRITVLRDGQTRGTFAAGDVSELELVDLVAGRKLKAQFPEKRHASVPGPNLAIAISGSGFADTTLDVRPGEIFGLAGIEGNGQRDFLRALAGVQASSGTVALGEQALNIATPASALKNGIVMVPGDRQAEGLFMSMSIQRNLTFLTMRTDSPGALLRPRREQRRAESLVGSFGIRAPGAEVSVSNLSGGNQQKVLLARTLADDPKVLLVDEPTAGVDVGTRAQIYGLLRDAANRGVRVLVTSTDALELAGICDRVAIFSRGHVVRTLSGDEVTEGGIVGSALSASTTKARREEASRTTRLRRFLGGDYAPSFILVCLIAALLAGTAAKSPDFLSTRNLSAMGAQIAVLSLLALGQSVVLMTGGVDLSVGPLVGLVTVVASYLTPLAFNAGQLLAGFLALAALGLVVGLFNGLAVRIGKITPIVVTLVTFIALQGISLLLRPLPGGSFNAGLATALNEKVGPVPLVLIIVVVIAVAAEGWLRLSRSGMRLRGVGSDSIAMRRLGGRVTRVHLLSYVACSILAAAAGVVFMAQTQVGDPTSGQAYTLTSITAVVLGGASLLGGRGSFLGALLGAIVLTVAITATTFLNLGIAWQIAIPGILTIGAAAAYSRARSVERAR